MISGPPAWAASATKSDSGTGEAEGTCTADIAPAAVTTPMRRSPPVCSSTNPVSALPSPSMSGIGPAVES